jgi:hypothetical protein
VGEFEVAAGAIASCAAYKQREVSGRSPLVEQPVPVFQYFGLDTRPSSIAVPRFRSHRE